MAATNHTLVKNLIVDNIALVDTTTDGGTAWLAAMTPLYDHIEDVSAISPSPQIGWLWRSAGLYVVPATLATSTLTLAADGSNHATVTYTDNHDSPAAEVAFDVNGAITPEATTNGVAVITVTASGVGPVVVSCNGLTVTMEAS